MINFKDYKNELRLIIILFSQSDRYLSYTSQLMSKLGLSDVFIKILKSLNDSNKALKVYILEHCILMNKSDSDIVQAFDFKIDKEIDEFTLNIHL